MILGAVAGALGAFLAVVGALLVWLSTRRPHVRGDSYAFLVGSLLLALGAALVTLGVLT